MPQPGRLWLSEAAISRSPVFPVLFWWGSVCARLLECTRIGSRSLVDVGWGIASSRCRGVCCPSRCYGGGGEPGSAAPGGGGPVAQVGDTGSSSGVHHPHQSGHPVGLLHHPQASFDVAALFPIRDTCFINLILQLPGQHNEPIHIQGERFDTQVLRRGRRGGGHGVGGRSETNPNGVGGSGGLGAGGGYPDPNSGGRLPEWAPCGHPHKFLGGKADRQGFRIPSQG